MAERKFMVVPPSTKVHTPGLGTPVDKNGEPPDDGNMEARVKKLEDFAQDTRDRLTRIEAGLGNFATKADLHEAINAQTWKLVTFVCGFGTALVAAVYFISTHTK